MPGRLFGRDDGAQELAGNPIAPAMIRIRTSLWTQRSTSETSIAGRAHEKRDFTRRCAPSCRRRRIQGDPIPDTVLLRTTLRTTRAPAMWPLSAAARAHSPTSIAVHDDGDVDATLCRRRLRPRACGFLRRGASATLPALLVRESALHVIRDISRARGDPSRSACTRFGIRPSNDLVQRGSRLLELARGDAEIAAVVLISFLRSLKLSESLTGARADDAEAQALVDEDDRGRAGAPTFHPSRPPSADRAQAAHARALVVTRRTGLATASARSECRPDVKAQTLQPLSPFHEEERKAGLYREHEHSPIQDDADGERSAGSHTGAVEGSHIPGIVSTSRRGTGPASAAHRPRGAEKD